MAGNLSPSIPTIGQDNSTEDVDVRDSIITLRDGLNAILNPSNGIDYPYRTILHGNGFTGSETITGKINEVGMLGYNLAANPSNLTDGLIFSEKDLDAEFSYSLAWFYFESGDYSISNKTTKLRLKSQVATNSVSPGLIKYTFGLYSITVSGASNQIYFKIGGQVGNSATVENPVSNKINNATSAVFNVPANGAYVLGTKVSAIPAEKSKQHLHSELQVVNQ